MRTYLPPEIKQNDSATQHSNQRRAEQLDSAHLSNRSSPGQHTATNGHSLSRIRILPERSDTSATPRVSLADPPVNAPAAPAPVTPDQPKAPATTPPVLASGEVEITDDGNDFTAPTAFFTGMTVYDVGSNFTVQTHNVKVTEDSPGAFVYGLVQNVLYDHFEATYTRGDMLVDSVGPFLDIWPTDPAPFFHEGGGDNPVAPSVLFTQLSVGAKYTDKPSWPLKPTARFCNEQVYLKSATRSLSFRVGLVARHVRTNELFQLGATTKTYLLKWHADIDTDTANRTLKSDNQLKGTYTLDKPGVTLQLAPPTAVTEVNTATQSETKDMETRCENVL
ncbi:MAG: hypothetical protein QOH49_1584 [Acidobacteriota bacterium]|nr:hypothetical protein [Acidobacteriota bacterium]